MSCYHKRRMLKCELSSANKTACLRANHGGHATPNDCRYHSLVCTIIPNNPVYKFADCALLMSHITIFIPYHAEDFGRE